MAEKKTKKTKTPNPETTEATEATHDDLAAPDAALDTEADTEAADTGMELMAQLMDHGSAVNLEPMDGEGPEAFQARIVEKINSVPDETWKTLPKATQLWFNDVVRSLREATASKAKETKAQKAKKQKLQKAKATAKEATTKELGTGFTRGTNAWEIMKIVQDNAGDEGMTMDRIIELAKKKQISSSNIPGRCRQIVVNGARRKDQYGGFIEITEDGKYKYIGRDLNQDPERSHPAKPAKPAKTAKTTAKTAKTTAKTEKPAKASKTSKTSKGKNSESA